MNMNCFYGDRLYAEYDKNGVHYKVKIYPCSEANNNNNTLYYGNYIDFKLIHRENIFGNIISVGNTNECVTNKKAVTDRYEVNTALCENNMSKYYNNYYMTKFVNIIDNNSSIFNSSKATIKFPKTFKKIKYAVIFWQGHVNNYSYQISNNYKRKDGYDKYYYDRETSGDYKNKKFYKWRKSNGKYYYKLSNDLPYNKINNILGTQANEIIAFFNDKPVRLIAKELDYKGDYRSFKDEKQDKYIKRYGVKYSAYTEINSTLLNALVKNNELNVTVANIYSTYGLDFRLGDYAGWSMIVIYEEDSNDPDSKLRSNSIYYGFKNLYKGDEHNHLNIEINNLLLPRYGKVDSKLSVFTAEGEYKNKGEKNNPESIFINNYLLSNFYKEVIAKDGEPIGRILKDYNNSNPPNVMDSILSDFDRKPYLANNNGIDIDNFDASDALTTYRDKKPNQTEYNINIHLTTNNDGYFVSEISFATELYQPRVCYYIDTITDSKGHKVYENGKFVDKIDTSKEYNISFWIANMKQNQDDNEIDTAQKVKLTLQYKNFDYLNNSTYVKNIGENNFNHITDQIGDDIGEFLSDKNQTILRIGIGANKTEGGEIPPTFNFNENTNKIFASIKGKFITDKKTIDLDNYLIYLASFQTPYINITKPIRIPKCKKFSTTGEVYNPPLGTFNVVNKDFSGNVDPIDSKNPLNALYTQIVNKPFDVTVLHLKDDNKTLSNYTGIVRVDLIQTPKDTNLSNLDLSKLNILDTKYVMFINSKKVNTNNTIPKSSFTSLKAVKNAVFLVRYLSDDDKHPISWTCMNNTFKCIWSIIKDSYDCANDIQSCPCEKECNPANTLPV